MRKLYVLLLNGKQYLTTNDAVSWDVCLRFGAELMHTTQTNRVIDGLEYRERSIEEIWESIKRLCAPVIKTLSATASHQRVAPINLPNECAIALNGGIISALNPTGEQIAQSSSVRITKTVTMLEGIMSLTGCSEKVARKVIAAKNAGDMRNIRELADMFKNAN